MKTKTVERLMNETPEHIKQQVSEYADEVVQNNASFVFKPSPKYIGCYCIGGDIGLKIYFKTKPKWFHRTMMKLCLGWKWENDTRL